MSATDSGRNSDDQLTTRLSTTSTAAERLDALYDIGLSPGAVARATDVSQQALRDWRAGSKPRQGAAYALDTLRCAALTLVEAGLEPQRVGAWFESKPGPGIPRPIDLVRSDPEAVLVAAEAHATEQFSQAEAVLRGAGERRDRLAESDQADETAGDMAAGQAPAASRRRPKGRRRA